MTKFDPPAPSIIVRSRAVDKAMIEVTKLRKDRQIKEGLRECNDSVTDNIS